MLRENRLLYIIIAERRKETDNGVMSCILILRQLGTLSVCVIYCRGKPQRQVALGRTYTATQFYAFYNRVKISSNCMCEMSGGSLLLIYLELSEAETFTFCCFIVPNRYIMPV